MSDLFRTVVTTMHNLKRKKCLRFAPPPPYEEMGEPAKKHVLSLSVLAHDSVVVAAASWEISRPKLPPKCT